MVSTDGYIRFGKIWNSWMESRAKEETNSRFSFEPTTGYFELGFTYDEYSLFMEEHMSTS
jgi:hypothetical protein